ncbi:MAG: ABC transporter ATP-binding protein [Acidobacteriota bacterium]
MNSESLLPGGDEKVGSSRPPARVRLRHLRKEFEFFARPWDRLVQWASLGHVRRGTPFVAVDDVDLSIEAGESVGIVGANGAGKSTLLKLICGVLHPTAGSVEVDGRLAGLLELGTGFHPEFTGRANIILNARFLGLHRDEIEERLDDIIAFAGVGRFIDQPLRTYSTGMQLRLAFAVAAHTRPDLLVVDEALAVGDAAFTHRCVERIRRFHATGGTLLFATHDPGMLKTLCDRALLIDRGRILVEGSPQEVLELYNERIALPAGTEEILVQERERVAHAPHRSGNWSALIRSVELLGGPGEARRAFISGEKITIEVEVCFLTAVENPTIGILIRDRLGRDVYGTNTHLLQIASGSFAPGEKLVVSFVMPLELGAGEYSLTVAAHTLDVHVHDSFDWIDRVVSFKVLPAATADSIGPVRLSPRVVLARPRAPEAPADWAPLLEEVFGAPVPDRIRAGTAAGPWLFRGWYEPEGEGASAFAWTRERFSFLIDLRGETLEVDAGYRPDAGHSGLATVRVWVFDQFLGAFPVHPDSPGAALRVPIPAAARCAAAVVTMEVAGWSPRGIGLNEDDRTLGLCVRCIEVRGPTMAQGRPLARSAHE